MSDQANETDPLDELFSALKQTRDELKLQMHLAQADARDEFERLEGEWKKIEDSAQPLTGAVQEAKEAGQAGAELIAEALEHAKEAGGDESERITGAVQEAAEAGGEQAKKVAGAALDVAARELQAGYEKLRAMLN